MPDSIPFDAYVDLRQVTAVSVSPSGDRIAFVADEFDAQADERRSALSVVPADGSREPHRLTRVSSASDPRWSPDGGRLAVLATREADLARQRARREPDGETADDGDGAEDPKAQVWLFDLERGGDPRQLTDFAEGVREFDWGPAGDRLVVSARDPTDEQAAYLERRREADGPIEVTRLQHKRDGVGWLDDVTTYLFVLDLPADGDAHDADSAVRLDDAYGAGGITPLVGVQPRWGPTDRIAFVTCLDDDPDDQPHTDLFTLAPDGSGRRRVTDGSLRVRSPRWTPDGERLAFIGGDPTNWYRPAEVYVVDDPADGAAGFRSVSASLDRTVAWTGTPEWTADGAIVTPIADEGWTRLVRLAADGDDPERVWDGLGRGRTIGPFDLAGDTVAVGVSAPDRPAEVFTLAATDLPGTPAPDDPSTCVTALNTEVTAEHSMPDHRRVRVQNSDGDAVEAIVYVPADLDPAADDPAPTIAAIHGGPMSYDAPAFRFDFAAWCSRGYLVVTPNYRGSTSYGRAWAERLKGARGDQESDDVVSAVRHLVSAGWADPDRLFCTGFSFGGITTAHVVTRYDDFAAAAPEHGIYDFSANFGTDDNHNWHEWEFGLPWEHPERYRDISSLTDVAAVDTPLLVTAGEEDWRCPPTQAEQLYVSVRKRGVDAKLVVYPGEHHNVGAPRRAVHRMETLTSWFESHDPAADT